MNSTVSLVLIVFTIVGGLYFVDDNQQEQNLIFDCAMFMTYKAAMQDGFEVADQDGGNSNYEVEKRKDGNTYVAAYASKPIPGEELNDGKVIEDVATIDQTMSSENGYSMRCWKTTNGTSTSTLVEKFTKVGDSYTWVSME